MKCSLFFVFLFFLYLKWLIIRVDVKKFKKIFVKCLQISKFCVPLQPQSRNKQCFKRCPDGGIGRRAGLKHQWIHFHPGSTPGLGTKEKAKY